MHYYQHHIGDFIKDTANLNDHQVATYMRMLWGYYADESPFDDDCESIAFAYRSDEKTVRLLLKHYFTLCADGWRHSRCDKEIAEYKGKADKARASANARWKNANALRTQNERSASEPISDANQEPITNNQEEAKEDTTYLANSGELAPEKDDAKPKSELSEMVGAYHRILPLCQSIHVLGDKRKRKMLAAEKMARLTCKQQGWDWDAAWFWDAYFTECSRDDWMAGKVLNKNNPAWKQNIEILIDEKRFSAVMDQTIAAIGEAG